MNGEHNNFREKPSETVKRLTSRVDEALARLHEKIPAKKVVRLLNHARVTDEDLDRHPKYVKTDIVEPLKSMLAFLNALSVYRGRPDAVARCKPFFDPGSTLDLPASESYLEVLEECCILAGDDIDEETMLRILDYAAPSKMRDDFILLLGMVTCLYLNISQPERMKAIRQRRGMP